jgi:glucose-1-phosphate thymidylyltransferase
MTRKGIILAGGTGSRLHPVTISISKQLLPVFDKPMIYYPLSTLMLADIREVLVICTPHDLTQFQDLLKDGSQWGMKIVYEVQPSPDGLAQAFIIAEAFLGGSPSALILGDNIFHGHSLPGLLKKAADHVKGASIFAYHVNDPQRYGVVEFDNTGKAIGIEEKPAVPRSNYAVTGMYYYDRHVSEYARQLKPSARGELEITDLNRIYLEAGSLKTQVMGRGFAWFDTGTHESLLDASHFVATLEHRQGLKVGCLEEIAFAKRWISGAQLELAANALGKSNYGQYLRRILNEEHFDFL